MARSVGIGLPTRMRFTRMREDIALYLSGGQNWTRRSKLVTGRERLEARVLLLEHELDLAGWAVPMLADQEVHRARVLIRRRFLLGEKHDQVGVLFERPRLPEVGQSRRSIPSRLGGTGQLGQREDGEVEILGQGLERPRYFRDLLLAVLAPETPLHELEIVDDHQFEAVLVLEPARLRAHLEDREVGRVVDVHGRLVQPTRRVVEPAPLPGLEVSRADVLRVHARRGAEEAMDQLGG